ncbi:MAG: dihydropteroate synthase [Candidatus Omnitrophica bacterium]|nr:dihydropteroate synthase [Candidatus Omnitrophota bacterium]
MNPAASPRPPHNVPRPLACGRFQLMVGGRTLVMGILNVTPDSFSDGGRYLDPSAACARARAMVDEGADLIDIGGESTRPGAAPVPAGEELRRVLPVIRALAPILPVPISVDTRKAVVAREAVAAGASLINDVTALTGDPDMGDVVARTGAPVILMHMQGTPETMQQGPRYADVVTEVTGWLREAAAGAQARGVAEAQILIDPGIGFGKRPGHNLQLLRAVDRFVATGYPVVVGPSRKSVIGAVLGGGPDERLMGTAAAVAWAASAGAAMVRVHDVRAMRQVVEMIEAVRRAA